MHLGRIVLLQACSGLLWIVGGRGVKVKGLDREGL